MRRARTIIALAALAAGAAAPATAAAQAVVPQATEDARIALDRRLGGQGVVQTDEQTGGVRVAARLDGFLTGADDDRGAGRIVLDYVRARRDVFRLDAADFDRLELVRRYRSTHGITYLTWAQTYGGIPAVNAHLKAAVTDDGRILSIQGGARGDIAVATTTPSLDERAAAKAAGGRADDAELVLFDAPREIRLAWRMTVDGEDVIVDARNGDVLRRTSLVHEADAGLAYDRFPGAPKGGTATVRDLAPYLNPNSTFLAGPNAKAWADLNDNNVADAGEHVAPTAGGDWTYPFTPVLSAQGACPKAGCSWNHNGPNSWQANVKQSTTQAFWYVNAFHDHLKANPIGFTSAAGGFEGDDALELNTNDGAAMAAGLPDNAHRNNANMFTPPDGQSPRMQMYLFGGGPYADVNGADDASIVMHEYTHGLVGRTVTDAGGRVAMSHVQSGAINEGTSDWYAMDYLVGKGLVDDTDAAGEVLIGEYVDGGRSINRSQALDCAIGAIAEACPASGSAGSGGYWYGDYGKVSGHGPEEHADGEIWVQTLWDLRRRMIADHGAQAGVDRARSLVTEGLRLAPPNPSFLDVRNAILASDTAFGGTDRAAIWDVFAKRGMGWYASALDGDDRQPIADSTKPPQGGGTTTTLTGKVTEHGTNAPVAGVDVAVGGHASSLASDLKATTGGDGTYAIPGVATGTYPQVVVTGSGYSRAVARNVSVGGAGGTADIKVRRNWADLTAGATLNPAPGVDPNGCGADAAFDGAQSSYWSAPAGAPQTATLVLPDTMDITGFGVDPGAGCGDEDAASVGSVTIFTAPEEGGWEQAATPTFGANDNHQLNTVGVAEGAKEGVRFVHVVMNAPQGSNAQYMDMAEFQVYATPNAGPTAAFTATPEAPETDETVTFTSTSADADGKIERHQWDLDGDGAYETDTGAVKTTTHSYETPGVQTVKLRVTDDTGDTATTSQSFAVDTSAEISDLGTLPGDAAAYSGDINRLGVVVGNSDAIDGSYRAFRFHGGSMTALPGLGGQSVAYNVNSAGEATGWSDDPSIANSRFRPVKWSAEGAVTDLGTLGGKEGIARGINNAGDIVGQAGKMVGTGSNEREAMHAFRWSGGTMTDLGTLGGTFGESAAYDINGFGHVVGHTDTDTGYEHAFLHDGGQMIDLGTLGGRTSEAKALNDLGQVVGTSQPGGGGSRPFLYSNGRMKSLGTLGGSEGGALDINLEGEVVGYSRDASGHYRAFSYRDGKLTDLNALLPKNTGWARLEAAFAINTSRQITGYGVKTNGLIRPFVLDLGDCEICVEEVTVEQRDWPSGEWKPLGAEPVADGNRIRVKAKIKNRGNEQQVTQVKLLDAEADTEVPDVAKQVESLDPNETADIEFDAFDTEGWAYGENGKPNTHRFVKVKLDVGATVFDTKTKRVAMQPKPAILVHGWKSNAINAWSNYGKVLATAHPHWKGYAVGDGIVPGIMNTDPRNGNTVHKNAQEVGKYLDGIREKTDADQVDLVVHSMGGLISRRYIHSYMGKNAEGQPLAEHLVMLGTPNRGSSCADLILGVGAAFQDQAKYIPTIELTPSVNARFNAEVTDRKDVKFSIVAGDKYAATCTTMERGDLVVSLSSAKHVFDDYATFPIVHMGMTDSQELFDFWVKPHLVPGAPQPPAPEGLRAAASSSSSERSAELAAAADGDAPAGPQLVVSEVAEVAGGATKEIPIAVPQATRLGVTHVTPDSMTSELVDPSGVVRETIAGGTLEGKAPFRTLSVASPQAGTWKLRLVAAAGPAAQVPVAAFVEGSTLTLDLKPGTPKDGKLPLVADLRDGSAPVTGAAVKAVLRSADATAEVDLVHTGDGRYTAETGLLEPGTYAVVATATGNGFKRTTLGSVDVPKPAEGGGNTGGDGGPGTPGGDTGKPGGDTGKTGGDTAKGGTASPGATPAPVPAPSAPAAPAAPAAVLKAAPRVSLDAKAIATTKSAVTVKLSCPTGTTGCTGTLELVTAKAVGKKGKLKVGSTSFRVAAGKTASIVVKVAAGARKLLGPGRKLAVVATATSRAGSASPQVTTARLTLAAAKKKGARK